MRRRKSPKAQKASRNKRRKYQVKGARPKIGASKRGEMGRELAER
jgi:hypothetical protein